ncbi:hypothetical protein QTO34_020245 [Cnephaeus nilssonii]|uniref:Disintegrin domain-containing protein n=1 Tax=Cnephaeus nilssonii TaxID=3371016 RepID=A0AA40HAE3_CNENI|nr:hypothetical protein QTO34_020245 [Eptesicus nilssonii]
MYRYPVLTDAFSNCSVSFLQNSYCADHAECLYLTAFVHANERLTVTRCGNSEVEDKEHCDCGSFKECYTNTCCKTDCSFTPGSACNRERCCTNCTYTPVGTLCRPIQNICDLPEYCMGRKRAAPMNFYLQHGTSCTKEAYCYHGNCTDRNMHCKEIFGKGHCMLQITATALMDWHADLDTVKLLMCSIHTLVIPLTICVDAYSLSTSLICRGCKNTWVSISLSGQTPGVLDWKHTVEQKQLTLVL